MKKSAKKWNYKEQEDEDESDSQCSQEEVKVKKRYQPIVPRFVKNDIEQIDTEVIIVNVSKTQYSVVEEVATELGWEVEKSRKSQKWDIMWIDNHIESYDLFKLHQHQKISHYPSIYVLTRKNFLGRSLMKMNKQFPQQYSFFPFTWNIPSDYTELIRYDKSVEGNYYIYKPEAMAQGKGIKIYNDLEQLSNKNGIVQTYINNPYLIEKLKFDLRIYVLILGYDPLRIFIYDEGLGRFATEKYQKVGKNNLKDVHMHLTNYSLNKNNKKFVFNTSHANMNKGHKRSLTAIFKYLASEGVNIQILKDKIDSIIVKTLLVGQPMIAHTYGLAQADQQANDLCFQILGFDILIDDQLNPILLQVNHTPSFKTDTPLDKYIKKNLIKDTFKLLDISIDKKKQKMSQKKQFIEKRSQRKLIKLTNQQKQKVKEEKRKERDEHEMKNLGSFRKIFPVDNRYATIIEYSNKIFNEYNGFKNKGSNICQGDNRRVNLQKTKSQQKFPNIKNVEKKRNYTGYLKKETTDEGLAQNLLEQQIMLCPQPLNYEQIGKKNNKGNFVAPKVVEINHPLIQPNSRDYFEFLSQGKTTSTVTQINKKEKNFQKIVEEKNWIEKKGFRQPSIRKLTYKFLIKNLSDCKNQLKTLKGKQKRERRDGKDILNFKLNQIG